MKKLLILAVLASVAVAVSAQPLRMERQGGRPNAFAGRGMVFGVDWRASVPSTREGVKLRTVEAELFWGYQFNSALSLFVPGTWTAGFFKRGEAKTYETTGQLGLGFAYSPLHTSTDRLEVALRAGSTLGGEWQYLYYDCGLRWQFSELWAPLSVGAGVRYYDCYGGGFSNYCNFYISVGIRIFHPCRTGK